MYKMGKSSMMVPFQQKVSTLSLDVGDQKLQGSIEHITTNDYYVVIIKRLIC